MKTTRAGACRCARTLVAWAVLACATTACADDAAAPSGAPPVAPRVLGVIELTFSGIGTPQFAARVRSARSIAELDALHAGPGGALSTLDLRPPANSDGSGSGTIQLKLLADADLAVSDTRYLTATYAVRNAQLDSVRYDTPRFNLTFLGVITENTIDQTAVRHWLLADGAPASPALTLELKPTGKAILDENGEVTIEHADVLQVYTEPQVADFPRPGGIISVLPYGFVTRNAKVSSTRTLPASPGAEQFDGVIDFGFRLPVSANPAEDPATITMLMLAVDDTDLKLTQSLEAQRPSAYPLVRSAAQDLGVSTVILLPGGALPGVPGTTMICAVRTAGPANAATAFLVDAAASLVSLSPDPYSLAGSFIAPDATISATFSAPVFDAGPRTMEVRGLQSGPAFLDQSYSGNGTTTITTPPGKFFPGEEVEIVVSTVLSCPQPVTARLRVRPTGGGSTFDPGVPINVGRMPSSIAVGDLNRDGKPDMVVTNAADGTATSILNNGNRTFNTLSAFSVGNTPWSGALGDLNEDGALDLVVANRGGPNLAVLRGNGNGTFGAPQSVNPGGEYYWATIADLNGDRLLDVAAAVFSPSPGGSAILMGSGDGRLASPLRFSTNGSPNFIAAGDLNRDGRLDLVLTDQNQPRVTPLLGNGDGTFVPQSALTVGNNPISIAIGDFDGNGIPDLAVANMNSSYVSVLLGNGSGGFAAQRTFAVENQSGAVVTADFDADGRLDLAISNKASSTVTILRGQGDGNFQLRQTLSPVSNPGAMNVADFNGDGMIDLAVANESQNQVTVFFGR